MTDPIYRPSLLAAAGLAALLAAAGPAPAQAEDLHGTITFAAGAAIPKGELKIHLEVPGAEAPQPEMAEVVSDGNATAVEFSVARPPTPSGALGLRVVVRLEREDGWLLGRGSAQVGADMAVHVVLHTVMY